MDAFHAHNPHDAIRPAERLLAGAVDGALTDAQWRELEALAARDPMLWRTLCEMHRDDLALRPLVSSPSVNASAHSLQLLQDRDEHVPRPSFSPRLGWALAAGLGLVASVQTVRVNRDLPISTSSTLPSLAQKDATPQAQSAGLFASPAQLWDAYVRSGQEQGSVVAEVPQQVLLSSSPAPDGLGFDVVYVRQVVERARVPGFFEVGRSDSGAWQALPTQPPQTPSLPPTFPPIPARKPRGV